VVANSAKAGAVGIVFPDDHKGEGVELHTIILEKSTSAVTYTCVLKIQPELPCVFKFVLGSFERWTSFSYFSVKIPLAAVSGNSFLLYLMRRIIGMMTAPIPRCADRYLAFYPESANLVSTIRNSVWSGKHNTTGQNIFYTYDNLGRKLLTIGQRR